MTSKNDSVSDGDEIKVESAQVASSKKVASKSRKSGAPSRKSKVKSGMGKKSRASRPFPASSFEEALAFARSVLEYGSGQPVRRLGIFNELKKSPESGASRMMVTNANKYGLIEGGYTADMLKPTEDGIRAASDETPPIEKARIRVKLAIEDIAPFKVLYDKYVGNKLPARSALIDAVKDADVAGSFAEEAIDTFTVNLRFVNLLQTLSGAERIIKIEHLLETIPKIESKGPSAPVLIGYGKPTTISTSEVLPLDKVCFYIAPIGAEGSEIRKHSDMMLGSIVEPALEQFKLSVVRADAISSPGIIGKQIIEHIVGAKLVVVDLSFHNPNVFYELAIRHMLRKPIVQIVRKLDGIPFDVNQLRTIMIDTSDLYNFVPKIATYQSEVSTQVRHALEDSDAADNPISILYPNLKVEIST